MEIKELGEFGLIRHLTKDHEPKNSSTVYGVGDDCAVDGGLAFFCGTDLAGDRGGGGGGRNDHRFIRGETRDVVEVDLHFAERISLDGKLAVNNIDDFAFDGGTVFQIDLVGTG